MTRTLSAIFFQRQKERTHAQLRNELAGVTPRLAAESAPGPTRENRIDDVRPGQGKNPPIDSSAAHIPIWEKLEVWSEKIDRKRQRANAYRQPGEG